MKKLRRELDAMRMKSASAAAGEASAVDVKGIKLLVQRVDGLERGPMRDLVDQMRSKLGSGVVVLGAAWMGRFALIVGVTKDLTAKVQAGKIVGTLAGWWAARAAGVRTWRRPAGATRAHWMARWRRRRKWWARCWGRIHPKTIGREVKNWAGFAEVRRVRHGGDVGRTCTASSNHELEGIPDSPGGDHDWPADRRGNRTELTICPTSILSACRVLRGNKPMERVLSKIQQIVVIALAGMMALVLVLSTAHLGVLIAEEIWTPPRFLIPVDGLLDIFGFFLLVLIGVELLQTLKAYLRKDAIQVRVVLEVALIAVARKVIVQEPIRLRPHLARRCGPHSRPGGCLVRRAAKARRPQSSSAKDSPVVPRVDGGGDGRRTTRRFCRERGAEGMSDYDSLRNSLQGCRGCSLGHLMVWGWNDVAQTRQAGCERGWDKVAWIR